MTASDRVFSGSIPEIYDEFLVPMIFETYAQDLADRVSRNRPMAVLETAAGSGVVARALAPLLQGAARYVVTDLNQPMLDRAESRQPPDSRIVWQQADAMELPFEDATFDAVCCQFGVMFFPDRVAGFAEARRVLRDGGRFVFNTWDRIEVNEFADVITRAASELFPDDPPLFLARTPHGYHDLDTIEHDVRAAGFRDVEISTIAEQSRAADTRIPAVAYCQGTPLRAELEVRDPGSLDRITDMAAIEIEKAFGTGPISGRIQAHVITAGN